jgi:hypothetical protein
MPAGARKNEEDPARAVQRMRSLRRQGALRRRGLVASPSNSTAGRAERAVNGA